MPLLLFWHFVSSSICTSKEEKQTLLPPLSRFVPCWKKQAETCEVYSIHLVHAASIQIAQAQKKTFTSPETFLSKTYFLPFGHSSVNHDLTDQNVSLPYSISFIYEFGAIQDTRFCTLVDLKLFTLRNSPTIACHRTAIHCGQFYGIPLLLLLIMMIMFLVSW